MKQKTRPQNYKLLIKKKAKDLNRHFSKKYLQTTWTDLEITILSELSQIDKYHILLICGILKKKKVQMNLFAKQSQRCGKYVWWGGDKLGA